MMPAINYGVLRCLSVMNIEMLWIFTWCRAVEEADGE
jgi:hypothetical protein